MSGLLSLATVGHHHLLLPMHMGQPINPQQIANDPLRFRQSSQSEETAPQLPSRHPPTTLPRHPILIHNSPAAMLPTSHPHQKPNSSQQQKTTLPPPSATLKGSSRPLQPPNSYQTRKRTNFAAESKNSPKQSPNSKRSKRDAPAAATVAAAAATAETATPSLLDLPLDQIIEYQSRQKRPARNPPSIRY